MSLVFNKRLPTSQEVSPPILSFSSILFDTSVDYGGSVTLNSTAVARNPSTNTNAPGTISYRWYKDGVLISGETGPTLTLTNQLSEASYYCEAQYIRTSTSAPALNSPITSNTARVTIKNYVVFTRQPSNSSVVIDKSATFGCSAVVGGFRSMVGFNDSPGSSGYFGPDDYNSAISLGFNDEDIRYYLENVYTGVIGPEILNKLNDINFGNSRNRNLQYQWFVDGVLQTTTIGPVCEAASGFNSGAHSPYLAPEISNPNSINYLTGLATVNYGIYLDLTEYPIGTRVQVQFTVTQDSGIVHRINIPELGTVNNNVNSVFLTDGSIAETLPNTSTPWGTRRLLLNGGRIYGPITSSTMGAGYLAVAGEIGTGGYNRLDLADDNKPVSQADDMRIEVDKGFFRSYILSGTQQRINLSGVKNGTRYFTDVIYTALNPPRTKYFSTYSATSSTTRSSSVVCKVVQINTSGALAGLPQNSNTVTWTVSNYDCISWDDSRKSGGQIRVLTNSGSKPGPVSTWYGPFVYGTFTDTCYFAFDLEVRDIYPRAAGSETGRPFIAVFQLRVRGQGGSGGDALNAFKVLEWNGNSSSANEGDKKTLRFTGNDFNGERVAPTGDGGRILFDRTNSNSPAAAGGRVNWSGTLSQIGQVCVDILFLAAKRKSDGADINSFLTVNSSKNDNILEYGRRYDQYEEVY